jgi:hypothetical protein
MFFEGQASARELAHDLVGTRTNTGPLLYRSSADHAIEPMAREFTVQAEHVADLVAAGIDGELTAEDLFVLSFCLQASDRFNWDADTVDGERVAEALFWLGAPEINWPLTQGVLARIHDYLVTGRNELDKRADLSVEPEV